MDFGSPELFSRFEPGAGARAAQGRSIARQRSLWYDLISLRLALQPVLERLNGLSGIRGGVEGGSPSAEEDAARKSLCALQESLLALGNAVRVASQRPGRGGLAGAEEPGEDNALSREAGPRLSPARNLEDLASSSSPYVLAELEAWQQAYGPGGAAKQPLATQISFILTDRARLRRRVIAEEPGAAAGGSGASRWVLSDREFYASLLKDFVANSSRASPQEFLRQLQAAKERRAVRKGYKSHMSKNRLINTRKVHRKLVNFVTPKDRPDGEYLRMIRGSIFGK